MFKSFYIHYHVGTGKVPSRMSRGFTLLVEASAEDPRAVVLKGTFCSSKDIFCKKTGRSFCADAEPVTMNKRQLPEWLAKMTEFTPNPKKDKDFFYVLKYVV